MTGLIIKLIGCPITIILASYIFPNVNYANLWQPILVGIILALAAHMMEIFLLKEGTLWTSTLIDFVAATLIVYIVSFFLAGAEVTFFGALMTGLLVAIVEFFLHRYLIKSGKTQKSST